MSKNRVKGGTWIPSIIKIAAVLTAAPRWTGTLLLAEGIPLPDAWAETWRAFSLFGSLGMAVVEAVAFAYIMEQRRADNTKRGRLVDIIIIIMLVDFAGILAPYIAYNAMIGPLGEILSPFWIWLWSLAVAMSTILVVGAVGYLQKPSGRSGSRSGSAAEEPAAVAETVATAEPTSKKRKGGPFSADCASCGWEGRQSGYATADGARNAINAHDCKPAAEAAAPSNGREPVVEMVENEPETEQK